MDDSFLSGCCTRWICNSSYTAKPEDTRSQDVVVPFRPASPLVPDTGIAMRDEAVLRRQAN